MTTRLTAPRSRIARRRAPAIGAAILSACLAGCGSAKPQSAASGAEVRAAAVPAAVAAAAAAAPQPGGTPLKTTKEMIVGMVPGAALAEPPDLNTATPQDLSVVLTAAPKVVNISGKQVLARTYNGSLVGPTLHVVPGQRVNIKLINALGDTPTNLHFHGMHLSPEGNSDNIFLSVPLGQSLTYHLDIPANQPLGTYWYHDHEMCPPPAQSTTGTSMSGMSMSDMSMSGMSMTPAATTSRCDLTESQIGSGLSGTIIVGDSRAPLPAAYSHITTHTLALKDAQISDTSSIIYPDAVFEPANPTVRLVNGQYQPTLKVQAGETQLWRIANEGYGIFYDVKLDTGSFTVVGHDGIPSTTPTRATHLVVPPGSRFDVLVTAGAAGSTMFRTLAYTNGTSVNADKYPNTPLMKVNVVGTSAPAGASKGMTTSPQIAGPLPGSQPDLSQEPLAGSRSVVLTGDFGDTHLINGQAFDMTTPTFATPATVGTVEEWTITNPSGANHPFHLHTAPFQVVSLNGVAQPAADYMDIVDVPAAVNGVPGKAVIRIRFTDFAGRWMFHCHITGHEDTGMMGFLNVVAAP